MSFAAYVASVVPPSSSADPLTSWKSREASAVPTKVDVLYETPPVMPVVPVMFVAHVVYVGAVPALRADAPKIAQFLSVDDVYCPVMPAVAAVLSDGTANVQL